MPAALEGTAGGKQRLGRQTKAAPTREPRAIEDAVYVKVMLFRSIAWAKSASRVRGKKRTELRRVRGAPARSVPPDCPRTSVLRGASELAAARSGTRRQDRQRQWAPARTLVSARSRPGLPGIRIKEEHNSSMSTAITPGKRRAPHRWPATTGVAPRRDVPGPAHRNR